MWTSSRDDMTLENWVPNHFVPLLPLNDIPDIVIVDEMLAVLDSDMDLSGLM